MSEQEARIFCDHRVDINAVVRAVMASKSVRDVRVVASGQGDTVFAKTTDPAGLIAALGVHSELLQVTWQPVPPPS